MASFTFSSVGDLFGVGTSVGAYLPNPIPGASSPVTGAAVTTAVVAADGSLAFSGLADDTAYVAYDSGSGKSRRFRSPPLVGSAGRGALFSADWRNATYGNVGQAGPNLALASALVSDYDHVLTEAADRLQYVRYPARRGLGSIRVEARLNDHDGNKNRTEMTATDGGKLWYNGDEVWFAYSFMWDPDYPFLATAGAFMLFHQFYGQDLFAQGGGGTTLARTITLPQASIELVDTRSLLPAGTVTISAQTVTYTGIAGNTLTGCTGGAGSISKGTAVSQDAPSTTLTSGITLPQASIPVASTAGFQASGMAQVGGQAFTYTSKDATNFLGCTGGTGTIANSSVVNGQISGGSPPFALELSSDGSQMLVHVRGGNKPTSQNDVSPRNDSYVLDPPTKGVWHDFLMHIKWSSGSGGLVEVWHRTAGGQFPTIPQVEASGANITSIQGHPLPVYAETGIYSDTGAATLVGYHGGARVARTRDAAEALWQDAAPQDAQSTPLPPGNLIVPLASGAPAVNNTQAATANQLRAARWTPLPKTGKLAEIAFWIETQSGNVILALYDAGALTASRLTKLWDSGSLVVGATGWQSVVPGASGVPASPIFARDQQLVAALIFDNAVAVFGRGPAAANAAKMKLPDTFLAPAGGVTAKLAGTHSPGSFAMPATFLDSAFASDVVVPMILGRMA